MSTQTTCSSEGTGRVHTRQKSRSNFHHRCWCHAWWRGDSAWCGARHQRKHVPPRSRAVILWPRPRPPPSPCSRPRSRERRGCRPRSTEAELPSARSAGAGRIRPSSFPFSPNGSGKRAAATRSFWCPASGPGLVLEQTSNAHFGNEPNYCTVLCWSSSCPSAVPVPQRTRQDSALKLPVFKSRAHRRPARDRGTPHCEYVRSRCPHYRRTRACERCSVGGERSCTSASEISDQMKLKTRDFREAWSGEIETDIEIHIQAQGSLRRASPGSQRLR
mmetsp:Transcript_13494/g.36012  ORF Transcript_13494/g.36012 Transcript_13494/m.36012 type:complete len:275 (-) Transcript_13494:1000-1824(-)